MKRIVISLTIAGCMSTSASAGYYWNPETDGANPHPAATTGIAAQAAAIKAMLDKRAEQGRVQADSDEEREVAQQRSRNEAAAAARAREEAEQNSPAGHIKGAEQQIRYCTARIWQARDALKQEDQIAKVSGVQDLGLRHEAGAAIVACQAKIEAAWREYRQYGGTAPSSSALVKKLIAEQ